MDKRVEKMDMELREFFVEQRTFFSEALTGVEARLGARIDGVEKGLEGRLGARIDGVEKRLGALEGRVEKMDRDMRAAFAGMDAKLSLLIERSKQ